MQIMHHLLSQNNYHPLSETLKYTLDKFKILTLISLLYEKNHSKKLTFTPMSGAYSLLSQPSLGRLFQSISEKICNEDNFFNTFFEISTTIYSHFNNMAREYDFGSNLIAHDIMYSIKHIVESLIYLFFEETKKDNFNNEKKFINEIKCYLAFFWLVFHEKSIIDFYRAKTACEILISSACQLSSSSWFSDEIFIFCSSAINSIITSYCQIQKDPIEKNISCLMFFIWNLRLVAEKKNLLNSMKKIDEYLSIRPSNINDAQWNKCLNLLESKKIEFNQRIDQLHIHMECVGYTSSDWFENFFYHLNKENISSGK